MGYFDYFNLSDIDRHKKCSYQLNQDILISCVKRCFHVLQRFVDNPNSNKLYFNYMKAITFSQYGGPEVLKLVEIDKPIPKDNEILIKQMATTVNSGDARLRRADPWLVRLMFGIFKPRIRILGNVISGVVEAVGKDVTTFKAGDEVFGLNDMTMRCYAEYIVVSDTTPLAIKPKNLNFEETASLVFGGHTALHFLKKAEVKKGDKILIYGASGAVGTTAIQLAKYYGAEVTAVTSTSNIELVKSLGADKVIDYTKENVSDMEGTFDVVYETVDKSEVSQIAKLVKPNGALILGAVIIKGMIQGTFASKKLKIKMIAGTASVTAKDMEFIAQLAESGNLKPVIDKTYNLTQISQAHEYVDSGHKKGSVVIDIISI
jgi:NADPH:quinone reductase-like Zn-dependent oxidoreductase